jgi:predicted nucleic acid-binding protein
VIYLDSSVVLAQILGEDRRPPQSLWQGDLVSSRLLEYEVWVRVYARKLGTAAEVAARIALVEVEMYELSHPILNRALQPFPVGLRTLDALHLATIDYLRRLDQEVVVASYDRRLLEAAAALGIAPAPL